MRHLHEAVPYNIHTILTDNGLHFTSTSGGGSAVRKIKKAIANREPFWAHSFELDSAQIDIDHRLTKLVHPWTKGQVEPVNRTIKDATVTLSLRNTSSASPASRRLRRCL